MFERSFELKKFLNNFCITNHILTQSVSNPNNFLQKIFQTAIENGHGRIYCFPP